MCARFLPFPTADRPEALWSPDPRSVACWDELTPGTSVTVVKRKINGTEAARYPATVIADEMPAPWRTLRAAWVLPATSQGTLTFEPGDILLERFSPEHPFDAFAVLDAEGARLKGWYANVTWPTLLERTESGLELTWQDLYLDLVITDAGTDVLDEDELADSPLPEACPRLTAAIREAIATMIDFARQQAAPFSPLPDVCRAE